jgi:hypothetical protein
MARKRHPAVRQGTSGEIKMQNQDRKYRVVIRYDDPRGGIWRGPIEDRASAEARLLTEAARAHGSVWIESL